MTTKVKSGPQDMPPPGGYASIRFSRSKLREIVTKKRFYIGVAVTQILGAVNNAYMGDDYYSRAYWVVDRCASFIPFIGAEADRQVLRRWRLIRDTEEEEMKNVKNWKVGTYWGEKIYLTAPKDYFPEFPLTILGTFSSQAHLDYSRRLKFTYS